MQRTTREIPSQIRKYDIVKDSEGRLFYVTGEPETIPGYVSVKGQPLNEKGFPEGGERFYDLDPDALVQVTYDETEQYV